VRTSKTNLLTTARTTAGSPAEISEEKEREMYQGLGRYNRERPDPLARREGESEEGWQRRTAPILRHAEATAEDPEWAAHRARVDQPTGSGSGLFGRATPTERAVAAGGTHGFGGAQRVERLGHVTAPGVPGQRGVVPRVYVDDFGDGQPGVSPLTAYLRGGH
jgi:hypothetical protein